MGKKRKRGPKSVKRSAKEEAAWSWRNNYMPDCDCDPCRNVRNNLQGGHALTITGVDWKEGIATVRNSWGYPEATVGPKEETDEDILRRAMFEGTVWPREIEEPEYYVSDKYVPVATGVAESSAGSRRDYPIPQFVKSPIPDSFQWSDNVARYETKPRKIATNAETCSIEIVSRIMAIGIVLFVCVGLKLALRRIK